MRGSITGSKAEDLFIDLFTETFGAEKTSYLYAQYPFYDIYQNSRFADFLIENGPKRIAIEIDDNATHHPGLVSYDKHGDDLLKQNSMIYLGWNVYRWTVRQMQIHPESVKDELRVFFGDSPHFKEVDDYLPRQRGKSLNGEHLELRGYQKEALDSLRRMRENHETIALLYQATGTGKTLVAVLDAKAFGGKVLFVAHTHELVYQAYDAFRTHYPEATAGRYVGGYREIETEIVCGSVQSVALNLDSFREDEFDYLVIDEAHHASAETYQKILAYFKPKFTLGLTATPERADEINILSIFRNTAHKLDIHTAVEIGALVPVRCFRIHTNIDMTKVRFNSVQYNIRDLDVKISVTERNNLIVETWLNFVKDRRTVIFCVSVKHAETIASLFRDRGVNAAAVSGGMKTTERNECLEKFKAGDLNVLCACDLLNEGWDCPETEVLFMARPTMSKVLYTQQLGRGMRNAPGKRNLFVFDFVDNANRYNAPYSLHRLFRLKDYRPGETVLGPKGAREADDALYRRGEKPEAVIDFPVSATDYELVDVFNWQEEASGMISQMEFVRRVDVQAETIDRYIREGLLVPDLTVPMSERRLLRYFTEETLRAAAERFGWRLISDSNRKDIFMEMIRQMDMSYSYKPVFIKGVLEHADDKGHVKIADLTNYFKTYYETRRRSGKRVEKPNSIYAKGGYSDKQVERNILINPFKRFEDMDMMNHTKTLGIIAVDSAVWKNLSPDDKTEIVSVCDEMLLRYFEHLENSQKME